MIKIERKIGKIIENIFAGVAMLLIGGAQALTLFAEIVAYPIGALIICMLALGTVIYFYLKVNNKIR